MELLEKKEKDSHKRRLVSAPSTPDAINSNSKSLKVLLASQQRLFLGDNWHMESNPHIITLNEVKTIDCTHSVLKGSKIILLKYTVYIK